MFDSRVLAIATLSAISVAAQTRPGLNMTLCEQMNWNLGDITDPYAPPKPWPVSGQQVYIKDEKNFCIALPNPSDPTLKQYYYDKGQLPTIVQAEGFVQAFCVGDYLTPGALPMPKGGITAAHVVKNFTKEGFNYYQITGRMNCAALNINCIGSAPGAYDDGGQYDDVAFVNCGKEPYSGVDASANPGLNHYIEQAGDGIFCIRVCDGGQQLGDPCNVKNDTAGCMATMNMVDRDGFSYYDVQTGLVRNSTPTAESPANSTTTSSQSKTSTSATAGASATTAGNTKTSDAGKNVQYLMAIGAVVATSLVGAFLAM